MKLWRMPTILPKNKTFREYFQIYDKNKVRGQYYRVNEKVTFNVALRLILF